MHICLDESLTSRVSKSSNYYIITLGSKILFHIIRKYKNIHLPTIFFASKHNQVIKLWQPGFETPWWLNTVAYFPSMKPSLHSHFQWKLSLDAGQIQTIEWLWATVKRNAQSLMFTATYHVYFSKKVATFDRICELNVSWLLLYSSHDSS